MTIKWNKVTEVLPQEDKEVLVWNGRYMFVSDAIFYNEKELRTHFGDLKIVDELLKSKGYFQEFGSKEYFDNESVYWAELPAPPERNTPGRKQ